MAHARGRESRGPGDRRGVRIRVATAWAGVAVAMVLVPTFASAAETSGADGAADDANRSGVIDIPANSRPAGVGGRGVGSEPGLDDLLRLPSDFETKSAGPPVAGASEDEWRRRFVRAEKTIGDAREALAATKRELDGMAESGGANQWSVAPPGSTGEQTTSPLSFKLRQQLTRNREELDEAEKALRELRIEADLAGVPPEWRVVADADPTPPPRP